jgi:hypothetical protein
MIQRTLQLKSRKASPIDHYIGEIMYIPMRVLHALTHDCDKDYVECFVKSIVDNSVIIVIHGNIELRVAPSYLKTYTEKLYNKICKGDCWINN